MRLSRRVLLCAGLAFGIEAEVRASDAEDRVLARIAAARVTLRTLRVPFVQVRTIVLLATEVRSRGMLTLVRPERIRWELGPPDNVTFWLGPEGLSFRGVHGGGRVPRTTARLGDALDDLRDLLGGDLTQLRGRWQIDGMRDDSAGVELEATPRDGTRSPIRRLRLALASDLIRPKTVQWLEGARDETVLEFGTCLVNAPVAEPEMLPPAGS